MENLKLLELTNFTYTDDIRLVDLALMLSDFEDDEIKKVCDALEDQYLARVLEEADQKVQKKIMYSIDSDRALRVFSFMSKDDSAGGIMTTEYIALYRRFTVSQAIEKIKEIAPKTEHIETIYVMNNKKKIVGTVSLRDLLVADHSEALEDLMNPNFMYVDPDLDQEEVAKIVSKYDLNAIPVINSQKVMLGIITVDDIVDVIIEEQTEDILKMGGVDKEETLDSTILQSVRRRLPWLLVNLATAFLASFTIKAFEGIIAQVVALSATMTIIAGMGGNAGSQTVSIIIRSLAMGKVKFNEVKKLIFKEVALGLINGAAVGVITGIIVSIMYGNVYLGLIIFLAMIGNLIISGFFGLIIPIILEKLHIDPAISSSIFLTTATDVLGFFLFLGLASLFLPKLI